MSGYKLAYKVVEITPDSNGIINIDFSECNSSSSNGIPLVVISGAQYAFVTATIFDGTKVIVYVKTVKNGNMVPFTNILLVKALLFYK